MRQSLDDVKVLELGSTVAAPYAAQILSQMGATVYKIEPPTGDPFRNAGVKTEDGISGYFSMCNCGKKSVRLNLKSEEGLSIFYSLLEDTDIVVENNRPGVVDRLGVGYEDVIDVNPAIIYCSLSGYGQDGPWSQRPGFDPILQGESGLMSVTGEKDGQPVRMGVAVVDLMSGVWTATAIMNALRHRDRTDEGTYIDMSMFDVAASMLTKRASEFFITGNSPGPMGTEDSWVAPYKAYPTKDDELLIVGAAFQRLWTRLCEVINREDLLEDDRFATVRARIDNRGQLNEILEEEFKKETRSYWLDILEGEIPVGRVANVEEALTNDHGQYRNLSTVVEYSDGSPVTVLNLPVKMDGEKSAFDSPPPEFGEHTRAVLEELGYSDSEINQLAADDTI